MTINRLMANLKRTGIGIVKDPLCHMILVGCLVYGLIPDASQTADPDEIIINEAFIDQISSDFHHTYLRPPSPHEQKEMVEAAAMDLALYYEGLKLELDQADQVVKRRVIQKMNFIIEGQATPKTPDLAELHRFMEEHPDRYRLPPRYDFEHVFISGTTAASNHKARQVLTGLQTEQASSEAPPGDFFVHGQQFKNVDTHKINRLFGESFASQLTARPSEITENQSTDSDDSPQPPWFGPIRSSYGWHLVRIDRITPESLPELHEVRDQVYADWKAWATEQNVTRIKQTILARYQVETPAENPAEQNVEDSNRYAAVQ